MKKFMKFLMWFFIIIFSLMIMLTVVSKLAENKITKMVLTKVSEEIKAPVSISDVSFTLLRRFPLATIELNGVFLGSPYPDSVSGPTPTDTLLTVNKLYVMAKTRPLLDGIIEVIKIEIQGVNVAYSVETGGKTNFDFLIPVDTLPETDTLPSEPLNAHLEMLLLKDIRCRYTDDDLKMAATVFIPEMKIKATAKNDAYRASIKGAMELSNCSYEGTNLHLMKQARCDFDMLYSADSIYLDQMDLLTDGASVNVTGKVFMGNDIFTDLVVQNLEMDMGELIKYAPAEMLAEYGVVKVGGKLKANITVKGIYNDFEMPLVDATLQYDEGLVITRDYPVLKNIALSGKVTNGELRNNKTTRVAFDKFYFETPKSNFNFAFSVADIDHPAYEVKSTMNIDMADFKAFVPADVAKSIEGKIKLSWFTRGQLPDSITDDFTDYVLANTRADVSLADINVNVDDTLTVESLSCQMTYRPNNFKLEGLNMSVPAYSVALKNTGFDLGFTGKSYLTSSLELDIRSYNIEMGTHKINGKATVKNLDFPTYTATTNIHLNLADLEAFLPDSTITLLNGEFDAGITSFGTINLDSIDAQAMALVFENSTFDMELKNMNLEMTDTLIKVQNLSGKVAMANDTIHINKVAGTLSGIDFKMDSTQIWNFYKAFMLERKDIDLIVQTNMELGIIDYNKLMATMPEEAPPTEAEVIQSVIESQQALLNTPAANTTTTKDTAPVSTALLPDYAALGMPHFIIRGKVAVKKIIYEKNVLDDFSMLFRFTDSLYVMDQCKFITCGGKVNSSFKLDARKNYFEPVFDMKNFTSGLDLQQLLLANDNFGDTTLTHENLSGTLTDEMYLRATFIGDSIPYDKIQLKGDFTLENGKLYNYQPLVDASVGIGGLKELDKMDFNTLKTSVFMFKNIVYIPKTDVVSNALDLSAFAMQSMAEDEDYEYHIELHLGDVLKGKSDKLMEAQAKQSKNEGETVDRNGINLVSMKVGNESKNGFDNEKLKKKFKNNLNKQEGFLNLLFNPNLVNYSTALDRTAFEREILEKKK